MTSVKLSRDSLQDLAFSVAPDFYLQRKSLLLSRRDATEIDGTFRWSLLQTGMPNPPEIIMKAAISKISYLKLGKFSVPPSGVLFTSAGQISVKIAEIKQSFALTGMEHDGFQFVSCLEKNTVTERPQTDSEHLAFFRPSLNMLDTITLSFGNPRNLVDFHPLKNNAVVTPGSPTTLTFSSQHFVTANSFVYISGFATDSVDDHQTAKQMNRSKGHFATVSSTTELTVPIDTSILSGTITGTVEVTFDFHDFSIPIELGYFVK
jgi:hypothetical protein